MIINIVLGSSSKGEYQIDTINITLVTTHNKTFL